MLIDMFLLSFSHGGVVAPYRNAERQRAVNHVAQHVGSGTGTAAYYDVPGADGHYRYGGYGHNGGHSYGHSSYGYGLHGHNHGGYGGHAYGGYGGGYGGYGHGYGHHNGGHYGGPHRY